MYCPNCGEQIDDKAVSRWKFEPYQALKPSFLPVAANLRLKYVQYVCVRLYQKSSKISAFWSLASLTAKF